MVKKIKINHEKLNGRTQEVISDMLNQLVDKDPKSTTILQSDENIDFDIWASTRENLSSGVCEQQGRRPACAYAQSDQRLCYSRFVKYNI